MSQLTIPLFPLNSVLFPGGPLPLRIFEPRYLAMISRCMKQKTGFGISLILAGSEVGKAADSYETGTLVRIHDWNQGRDGLLEITIMGEQRFRILSRRVEKDQLSMADVELLPHEPEIPVPASLASLPKLLKDLIEQVGPLYGQLPSNLDDASWVGARLTELLPLALQWKQKLLQLDDPIARLEALKQYLQE